MKRREFICGVSCLMAGLSIGYILPHNFIKNNSSSNYNDIDRHELGGFTVATSSHCNLCCKGCDTYSPLAKEEFVTYEQFSRDMETLKQLAPERSFNISFLGGEPLLNPDLTKMIRKVKSLNNDNNICILSNGLLLSQMDDEFWQTIKDCYVGFNITRYPISIDREAYLKKANEYGVEIREDIVRSDKLYDLNTREVIDNNNKANQDGFVWSKNILDLKGKQDYIEKRKKLSSSWYSSICERKYILLLCTCIY